MSRKKRVELVVAIPFRDPSDLSKNLAGSDSPEFFSLRIFRVPKWGNPESCLGSRMRIWQFAGDLSDRAVAYYVEQNRLIQTDLPESELTAEEKAEVKRLKIGLQSRLRNYAQAEFDEPWPRKA